MNRLLSTPRIPIAVGMGLLIVGISPAVSNAQEDNIANVIARSGSVPTQSVPLTADTGLEPRQRQVQQHLDAIQSKLGDIERIEEVIEDCRMTPSNSSYTELDRLTCQREGLEGLAREHADLASTVEEVTVALRGGAETIRRMIRNKGRSSRTDGAIPNLQRQIDTILSSARRHFAGFPEDVTVDDLSRADREQLQMWYDEYQSYGNRLRRHQAFAERETDLKAHLEGEAHRWEDAVSSARLFGHRVTLSLGELQEASVLVKEHARLLEFTTSIDASPLFNAASAVLNGSTAIDDIDPAEVPRSQPRNPLSTPFHPGLDGFLDAVFQRNRG